MQISYRKHKTLDGLLHLAYFSWFLGFIICVYMCLWAETACICLFYQLILCFLSSCSSLPGYWKWVLWVCVNEKIYIYIYINRNNSAGVWRVWCINKLPRLRDIGHHPISIKRLDIFLFLNRRWYNPISGSPSRSPTHLLFSRLSDSPLRSCSFYVKSCCTLIPTICVGSVNTATLSTFCMLGQYPGCHWLCFPTIHAYSLSPRNNEQCQAIFVDSPGSQLRQWIDVRYWGNMRCTIWDRDI